MLTQIQQEFFAAAHEGDVDILKDLLESDPSLIGKEKPNGFYVYAIEIAAANAKFEAVKFLIESGSIISVLALSVVIGSGNLEMVKFLVDHGAKISELGSLAVSVAAASGNLEAVKFVFEQGAKISEDDFIAENSIKQAVHNNNLEMVKLLVENGGKISEKVIEEAAIIGNLEIVKLLVENGGKINKLAVEAAVKRGTFETVKFLVEHGGEISDLAVEVAVKSNNFETVKFLVENGGKINEWAVEEAVHSNNFEIVKFLVKHGGEIDFTGYGAKGYKLLKELGNTDEEIIHNVLFSGYECSSTREKLELIGKINKALTEKDNWDIIKENHATFRALDTDTEAKIPLVTHHIWLTNISNPKELTEHMKSWAKNSKAKLNDKWEHYFWVNSKDALPETVKGLSDGGFIFKEVSELGELYLQTEYQKAVEERKFGLASDMLRYEILNKHGGLYFDTDYELVNDLSKLHYNSDFYVGNEPFGDLMLGNAIIGSKKDHIIITKILEHIKTWSNNETAPNFLENCNNFDQTLYITGPFAISKAFLENSGKGGNIDLVIRPEAIYSMHYLDDRKYNVATGGEVSDVNCENEYCHLTDEESAPIILGYHYWANTWVKKEFGSNG
jgi:ankyrin repeat protein